jgi:ankyrin repeat protein
MRRGHLELAALLLRYGVRRSDIGLNDEAAFVDACMRLDRGAAEHMLREHPGYLRSTAALFAAAKANRADVAALLLDLGVPPDVEDDTKQRALHIAAYEDAIEVGTLLVERGAEIDPVEQNFDNTPLDAAVYAHSPRMIELLGRYSSELWNLTFTGSEARLRVLIEQRPERARTRTDKNETLLMWLPDDEARALRIIELLLEHGADPTVRSREGRTAADYAVRRGLLKAAARLRAAAAAAGNTNNQS